MTRIPYEHHHHEMADHEKESPGRQAAGRTDGDGFDELALRRLLHDAVRDVEPRPEALDRLCRAVPARRARRRQVLAGAAAGVLLVGTAVPALWHAAHARGRDTAGNVSATSGLAPGSGPGAGAPAPTGTAGAPGVPAASATAVAGRTSASAASATASGVQSAPGATLGAAPACVRTQLGQGSASTGSPDARGRVYGDFRVVNVSGQPCTVSGASEIAVTTRAGTDPGSIQVVDHTQGDPATGLPDPAEEPAAVLLPPGEAYEVQFAWIPASGGGTTGCATGRPSPPVDDGSGSGASAGTGASHGPEGPDPSGGGSGAGASNGVEAADTAPASVSSGPSDGGSPSETPPDDGSAPPSAPPDGIALSNVPPEGGPAAASTDITDACAGTVYQTDPLPTP